MHILFGIVQGGGGFGYTPGGKPIPIDPEGWRQLSSPKRDILTGLAITQLASMIDDPEARQKIEQAALNVISKAVQVLKQQK